VENQPKTQFPERCADFSDDDVIAKILLEKLTKMNMK